MKQRLANSQGPAASSSKPILTKRTQRPDGYILMLHKYLHQKKPENSTPGMGLLGASFAPPPVGRLCFSLRQVGLWARGAGR